MDTTDTALVLTMNNLLATTSTSHMDPSQYNDPKTKFTYSTDNQQSNFDQALVEIERSELLTNDTKRLLKRTIDILDKNQGGFSVNHLDGYLFKQYASDSKPIYLANNNPVDISIHENSSLAVKRIGLFDLHSVRSVFSLYDDYARTRTYLNVLLGINLAGFLGFGTYWLRKKY